jgi:RimJ/RimL family protein N-acetyltransferase
MTDICNDDVFARGRQTIIRRKRLDDSRDEYRWRSDPELATFDASRAIQSDYDNFERNWSFDYRFTDVAGRSFAIEDAHGRHIGNVMYYNIDQQKSEAEIGISIGERAFWSRGYGSDAIVAMTRALLRKSDLKRLYLHTLDWNERAHGAFSRAGFEVCGTSWRDGHTFLVMELRRSTLEGAARPSGVRAPVAAEVTVAT